MTRFSLTSSLLVVAAAGFVGVESISISQQCQAALLGVAGSPEATCLNVGGLLTLFTAPANVSLVPDINTWLAGACAETPCTNQQLADITTNITTGCAGDLSAFGIGAGNTQTVIQTVQTGYPTVRKIACLKSTSNSTLCTTTALDDVQAQYGTLSADNIVAQLPVILSGHAVTIPNGFACSDCGKAAYNVLNADQPALATSTDVTGPLVSMCGTAILNGASPTGVVEGTGSAAPTGTSKSGALSSFITRGAFVGVAISTLATLAAGLFTLV